MNVAQQDKVTGSRWCQRPEDEVMSSLVKFNTWRIDNITNRVKDFDVEWNDVGGPGHKLRSKFEQALVLQDQLAVNLLNKVNDLIFLKSAEWVHSNLPHIREMVGKELEEGCDKYPNEVDIMINRSMCINWPRDDTIVSGDMINDVIIGTLRSLYRHPFSFYKFNKELKNNYKWGYDHPREGGSQSCTIVSKLNLAVLEYTGALLSGIAFTFFNSSYKLPTNNIGYRQVYDRTNTLCYKLAWHAHGRHGIDWERHTTWMKMSRVWDEQGIIRLVNELNSHNPDLRNYLVICGHMATLELKLTKEGVAKIQNQAFLQVAGKNNMLPECSD